MMLGWATNFQLKITYNVMLNRNVFTIKEYSLNAECWTYFRATNVDKV